MTTAATLQAAYARKRRAHTGAATVATVTRPLRHIGQPDMEHAPSITYRADMEADVRERLRAAGMEFADEAPTKGTFW